MHRVPVSAWIKPESVTGHRSFMSKWGQKSEGWEWDFFVNDGKLTLMLNAEDSDCGNNEHLAWVDSKLIPTNKWTHVAGTYDGIKIQLYLNGTEYAVSSQSKMPVAELCDTTEKMKLGVSGYYENDFLGWVDEVKVSNYARSSKEVCEKDTNFKWMNQRCVSMDFDKDGYRTSQGDCDDLNPQKYPGNGCPVASAAETELRSELAFSSELEQVEIDTATSVAQDIDSTSFGLTLHSGLTVALWDAIFSALTFERVEAAEAPKAISPKDTFSSPKPSDPQAASEKSSQSSQMSAAPQPTVTLYYNYQDHLGNIVFVEDSHGSPVEVMDYLPYGNLKVHQTFGNHESQYKYNDKEKDEELNLYYYGARYYDDARGRFTSVDPALFDTGYLLQVFSDPQLLNSYSYVGNNPLRFIDEEGKDRIDIAAGYVVGLFKGAWNFVKGLYQTIRHPVLAVQAIWAVIENYELIKPYLEDEWENFVNADDYEKGETIGKIVGEVATPAAILKAAGKLKVIERLNELESKGVKLKLHKGEQGKHIPGDNNFMEGKSIFTHPDPEGLFNQFAGTGKAVDSKIPLGPGYKERVNFGVEIGEWLNPGKGVYFKTTKGIIHHGKKGGHIVPSDPLAD